MVLKPPPRMTGLASHQPRQRAMENGRTEGDAFGLRDPVGRPARPVLGRGRGNEQEGSAALRGLAWPRPGIGAPALNYHSSRTQGQRGRINLLSPYAREGESRAKGP